MIGERTRSWGGNGLRNLENAVAVEMTAQQDLWLWVMELSYHQAQGQREGTWRINTPIALSSYSFIFCYRPFIIASHWLKAKGSQKARQPYWCHPQRSNLLGHWVSGEGQRIELEWRMGEFQHSSLGQRGPHFSKVPTMFKWFKDYSLGYRKRHGVAFLDFIPSHSFLTPISSKFIILCSQPAMRLLMSSQEVMSLRGSMAEWLSAWVLKPDYPVPALVGTILALILGTSGSW